MQASAGGTALRGAAACEIDQGVLKDGAGDAVNGDDRRGPAGCSRRGRDARHAGPSGCAGQGVHSPFAGS